MQVEQVRKVAAPALADGDGGVEGRHAALGDAHDADPPRVDAGVVTQKGKSCEGIALHLRAGNQGLVGHGAAHAATGEAVDDQCRRPGLIEDLGVIVLAVALHAGAAGQDHHARRGTFSPGWHVQAGAQPRRAAGCRMIERQCIERHRFHGPCLACPLGCAP